MPQLPNAARVQHVLERARVLHGEDTAERMADALVSDWSDAAEHGHLQAVYAAMWQLTRAASYRAHGESSVANMFDHLAEACVVGWRDEMTVQTTAIEDTPPS